MKQVITKEDVSKVMSNLTNQGKSTTLAAIHAALGGRGSMKTLVDLRREIVANAEAPNASVEAVEAFRTVWASAVDEGQKKQAARIAELQESVDSLAVENERLEGVAMAANSRANELELAKSCSETELRQFRARAEAELDKTRAAVGQVEIKATDAMEKLAATQAMHATQVAAIQADRDNAVDKAHDIELKLARALALLEARSYQMPGAA